MGRQARQVTKGFTARLTGKAERGADRKVRRGSPSSYMMSPVLNHQTNNANSAGHT